jgi:hypothetical protein
MKDKNHTPPFSVFMFNGQQRTNDNQSAKSRRYSPADYYDLIKTRPKEKYPRHPDWDHHEEEWFNPYRGGLVNTIQSKINKGDAQADSEDICNQLHN